MVKNYHRSKYWVIYFCSHFNNNVLNIKYEILTLFYEDEAKKLHYTEKKNISTGNATLRMVEFKS